MDREEVRFRSGDVELAGTLVRPRVARPPAVVIVHGSGSADRTNPWTLAFTEALARRGIAVLHPDKRGSGASAGDWRTASFRELAADASRGVALLRARGDVDSARVGVLAFSQGGYVASIVAAEDSACAFAAVISGSTAALGDQMVDEILSEATREGTPLGAAETAALRAVYARAFAAAPEARAWAGVRAAADSARRADPRLARALRTLPADPSHWAVRWIARTGNFDPMPYWRRARHPVALLYGVRDAQVRARASVERLWDGVGVDAPNFTVLLLQGNAHALYREDAVSFLERWIRDGGAP